MEDIISTDAIIGYTGFVGGTLAVQRTFFAKFNTSNIRDLADQRFETVICAAAPGSMFAANREPERDREQINILIENLKKVRARRFVLISSIAVLANFAGRDDEDSDSFQEELAYGRHRRALEVFVEENFEDSLVVRLPALFGHGLRKNFVFDLLNPIPTLLSKARFQSLSVRLSRRLSDQLSKFYSPDPATGLLKLSRSSLDADPIRASLEEAVNALGFGAIQFHNPEASFQFYNMDRLSSDIDIALQARLSHIHLVPQPLKAAAIYHRLTGCNMPESNVPVHHEDMRTRHSELWGRQGPYLEDAESVMDQLGCFVASERRTSP